ncbi:hypothetical protein PIROE2DRAFT_12973 [Piromyces sp. E2]|nr:hypothetical protein PIROE2DRAFT_12973 [Piromyces sp. E2]|eukprot:OUM61101.1 hypothetical protein PIROE2DRAFT_12973 [Piromyces sp. E2]
MKNIPISMLKWGKSALHGSSWKHKHSFSTSELEYKFNRNSYRKMDNNSDFDPNFVGRTDDNFILKTNNNIKEKEKWLSTSLSSNDTFSSISINSNNSNNNVSILSESIKEKDALEWKKYVQYEIKDNDYLNLNINDLLKDYIDKNKNTNKSSLKTLSTDIYKNKTININSSDNRPTYNVDIKPIIPSSINTNYKTKYYSRSENGSNIYGMNSNIPSSNNSIRTHKKSLSASYDIQTIEYNLKYNSNYDVENIPEEVIMELLNNQLHFKETDETSTSNSNIKSPSSSPISSIPSPLQRPSSLNNYKLNFNDTDTISKEDNCSFISELTASIPQTAPPTDKPENNWNSLYVINEIQDLSIYSNNPEYNSKIKNTSPSKNIDDPFDYSQYSTSADYHQFYLENRPKSINRKQKKGIKNAIKVSYKHLSMKIKQRRASTSTIETGTTFYSFDNNENNTSFTDIISFNDALNLPIEKNSK